MINKIKGALFGVAIGDALGATTEFMSEGYIKATYGHLTDIIGGGWLGLKPGETTDDTAMTIAVAKGLISDPLDPVRNIGEEIRNWIKSNPKDIGNIIKTAHHYYVGNWFKAAEDAHEKLNGKSAGNGSLMRCLPVALVYKDLTNVQEITMLQSKLTHYDDLATEACLIYNRIAYRILEGESLKPSIEEEIKETKYIEAIKDRPNVPPDGYVVNTLKWVLNILWTSSSFEEVVQTAANLGGDSDTIGAIAGGLAGLYWGFESIPKRYVEVLLLKDELQTLAEKLLNTRTYLIEKDLSQKVRMSKNFHWDELTQTHILKELSTTILKGIYKDYLKGKRVVCIDDFNKHGEIITFLRQHKFQSHLHYEFYKSYLYLKEHGYITSDQIGYLQITQKGIEFIKQVNKNQQ